MNILNYLSNLVTSFFEKKVYENSYLIFKFNPFNSAKCDNFDKFIIFQAAIFLFLTTDFMKLF